MSEQEYAAYADLNLALLVAQTVLLLTVIILLTIGVVMILKRMR